MIVRAKVTSKGQVTLPVAVRRELAIAEGDDLEFETTREGVTLRVVHRRPLASFLGALNVAEVLPDHAAERRLAATRRAEHRK
jgi:AbrB family looped-hinge helix DNA binding protein